MVGRFVFGGRLGAAMMWIGIGLGAAGLVALVLLFYWQMVLAEGAYLGPRVVAWTYDWVARRYDAIKQFDLRHESAFLAEPLLRVLAGVRCPLVLDVATGTGRLPAALLRGRFGGQIVGLDLSWRMLRQACAKLRPNAGRVHWVWQDAGRLPFDEGTFDAVTCIEALEFLPRPMEALAEMVRVLAPGGVLFVTNRIGCEAVFLPGRAIPRHLFRQTLEGYSLHDVEVRRWQVSYDLAMARKEGPALREGRCGIEWTTLLRCPACSSRLEPNAEKLHCPHCGTDYAICEGIVRLADQEEWHGPSGR